MASRTVVIASTARTGLAKSFRGGFNKTHGAAMLGHAIEHAVRLDNLEALDDAQRVHDKMHKRRLSTGTRH